MNEDFSSVINSYVKRKSIGEINFDKKQKDSGIKICEHLIHQHSCNKNEKDKLKIVTQISHVSDNCETPVPLIDNSVKNLKNDTMTVDQDQNSPPIADYYFKSLSLFHGKSKSLEVGNETKVNGCHRTKVIAIVGDTGSNYERVYNTEFVHSSTGNKIEKEISFTRYVASSNSSTNSHPSSYYSLPSQIHKNSLMMPSTDKLSQPNKKKLNKKKWKRLFSTSKTKKNDVNLKEIEKLATQSLCVSSEEHSARIVNRHDSKKSSSLVINIHQDVPFRSYKIGEKLQPMDRDKKRKKVPAFFKSILSPQKFLLKSDNEINNNRVRLKENTIEIDPPTEEKSRMIVAEYSKCDSTEEFQYALDTDKKDYTDGNDDDDDCNDVFCNEKSTRQRSVSGNVSFSHYDISISDKQRRPSCPAAPNTCKCNSRRINLIVDVLQLLVAKKKDQNVLNQKQDEIKKFDQAIYHFNDCGVSKTLQESSASKSEENWRQSQASLYSINSCVMCTDVDGHLNENISPALIPLLNQLETEDEINCPVETIEYFLHATCYKHFEDGLLKIIGPQCTIRNVALLHYLTKRIVKHIGDPTDDNNKKIKKIIRFAERFYLETYSPHVLQVHGSLVSFLVSCNDNEDVD